MGKIINSISKRLMIFQGLWSLAIIFGVAIVCARCAPRPRLYTEDLKFALKIVMNRPDKSDNSVVSPLSLKYALNILKLGLEKTCSKELEKLFNETNKRKAIKYLKTYRENLDNATVIKMANLIFYRKTSILKPKFKKNAEDKFNAFFESIDFNNAQQARKLINDKITNSTEGKITNVIEPNDIDQATKIIIINSLIFNAKWNSPFNKRFDGEYPLLNPNGKVTMMRGTDRVLYHNSTEFLMICKSYTVKFLKMLIILPHKNLNITNFSKTILENPDILNKALAMAKVRQSDITMPVIRQISGVNMLNVMEKLNITCLRNCTVTMLKTENARVSKMMHRVDFKAELFGTIAAAVTNTKVTSRSGSESEKIIVEVDRPSLFIVADTKSGFVYYVGELSHASHISH